MSAHRLLLLSNSRDPEGRMLVWAHDALRAFLGDVRRALFVPFAAVVNSYDGYTALARDAFAPIGVGLESVHAASDARAAMVDAPAIVVGGGNTFRLLERLYETELLETIRECVRGGTPYVGWSAGALVACPTIRTTNDMPITEPPSLTALGLVPFQINAHYTEFHPPGFQGETRRQRLAEFLVLNPTMRVIGLPECTLLRIEHDRMALEGREPARLFAAGAEVELRPPGEPLDELLVAPS